MRFVSLPAATLLGITVVGCATQQPPQSYVSSTQGTSMVQTAQVTDVRDVTVNSGRSPGVGPIVGSALGGIAGSNIGGGKGRTVAAVGGAVAGGAAGHALEKSGAATTVTQLTVRFANGDTTTYNIDPTETFRIGDTVKVITTQGRIRISR